MTDYVDLDLKVKIANNAERDPLMARLVHQMNANRSAGYAREDARIIISAADEMALDFDAFAVDSWLDLVVVNEGSNACNVTLSDTTGDFTIVLPADQLIVVRHYKSSSPGSPKVASTAGTTVRLFAWGQPYVTPT